MEHKFDNKTNKLTIHHTLKCNIECKIDLYFIIFRDYDELYFNEWRPDKYPEIDLKNKKVLKQLIKDYYELGVKIYDFSDKIRKNESCSLVLGYFSFYYSKNIYTIYLENLYMPHKTSDDVLDKINIDVDISEKRYEFADSWGDIYDKYKQWDFPYLNLYNRKCIRELLTRYEL